MSSNALEQGLDRILCLESLKSLLLDNNNLQDIPPELGAMSNLCAITLHGNPQRTVRSNILQQGSDVILRFLKDKIVIPTKVSSAVLASELPNPEQFPSEIQILEADMHALESQLLDRSATESKK